MSYAYTPGLKVKDSTIVKKIRVLPIIGEVHVKKGEFVSYDTVVASTYVQGGVNMSNAAMILDVEPSLLQLVMLKKVGDDVKKGDIIGLSRQFFGLIKKELKSEVDGKIELISDVTGTVAIREAPILLTTNAYISGKIIEIIPKKGVVIETSAALVQGIFGIGGETHGELMVIAPPNEIISPENINDNCKGKILIGGSQITYEAFKKAIEVGANGIIAGGIKRVDVNEILGYELGVAITGKEKIPLTCIVTEGFGEMKIPEHTYKLLSSLEGMVASINGATQIRAGVIRPEIIIQLKSQAVKNNKTEILMKGMVPGTMVRVIREPNFGVIGEIHSLPIEPQQIETESKVRIVLVKLGDGTVVTVPRANVELMEQ